MLFAAASAVADALGARLVVYLSWQGEMLDRLVDAAHAELQNAVVHMLTAAGWLCAVEVSFQPLRRPWPVRHPRLSRRHWDRSSSSNVKTAIGDIQATLGQLDVKVRLAREVARERGWSARHVVRMLVIADERQQHRIVARHARLFAEFSLRSHAARAWLRRPAPDVGGLLIYLGLTDARIIGTRRAQRETRIRHRNATDAHAKGVTQALPRSEASRPSKISRLG